jgi:hypothetical protein
VKFNPSPAWLEARVRSSGTVWGQTVLFDGESRCALLEGMETKRLSKPQPLLIGNYNTGIQRGVNLANEKSVLQHKRKILTPGKDLSAQTFLHNGFEL